MDNGPHIMKSAPPLSDSDSDVTSEQAALPEQDSKIVQNDETTSLSNMGTEKVDVEKKDVSVYKSDVGTSDKDTSKILGFE